MSAPSRRCREWFQRASRRPGGTAAVAILLLLALVGCHREKETAEAPLPPADASYTVRGVVWQLPAPPADELVVHHEAIPDFVDRKGERSGMDSMTMPFAVAPGVSLADLAAGDKVEMTFEIRWEDADLRVVKLTELPPETDLRLGAAGGAIASDPPAPTQAPAPAGGESPGSPSPSPTAGSEHDHH